MIDVAVVGSLHLDIMVAAPRLPARDETLIGSAWHYKCGGKGGNQAVAAARFGARTAFGGRKMVPAPKEQAYMSKTVPLLILMQVY